MIFQGRRIDFTFTHIQIPHVKSFRMICCTTNLVKSYEVLCTICLFIWLTLSATARKPFRAQQINHLKSDISSEAKLTNVRMGGGVRIDRFC